MKQFIEEFKAFIMRGSVLDLAVAVVIAAAFGPIITSVVGDVIMPIIGRIIGEPSFTHLSIDLGKGAVIGYGNLITHIVNFILVGAALFLIIKGYNKTKKPKAEAPAAPKGPTQEELLSEIRDLLKK